MDRITPQRGNEQLALGNQPQKYIRPDGAKALFHTLMLLPRQVFAPIRELYLS